MSTEEKLFGTTYNKNKKSKLFIAALMTLAWIFKQVTTPRPRTMQANEILNRGES